MAEKTLGVRQKQKYDTSANWTTNNPILLAGEIGIESDTSKIKIGDGLTAWNNLEYFSGSGVDLSGYVKSTETATSEEGESLKTELTNSGENFTAISSVMGEVDGEEVPTDYGAIMTSPTATLMTTVDGESEHIGQVYVTPDLVDITSADAVNINGESLTFNEKAIATTDDIPTTLAALTEDSTHRTVTDAEKSTWSAKQDAISDLATIRSGASAGATAVQTETDPTVPSWAKAATKPTYSYSEITGTPTIDSALSSSSTNAVQNKIISDALAGKFPYYPDTITATTDLNTITDVGIYSVPVLTDYTASHAPNATGGTLIVSSKATIFGQEASPQFFIGYYYGGTYSGVYWRTSEYGEWKQFALSSQIPASSTLVHITGAETIEGTKNFTGGIMKKGTHLCTPLEMYPVGAIYLSVDSTSPASFLGGAWTKIDGGYALWITTSAAGSTITAGLPNITGTLGTGNNYPIGGSSQNTNVSGSGALKSTRVGQIGGFGNGNGYSQSYKFEFNASSSNSIYGSSTTVQPPAYRVYAWRRTA